MSRWLLAAPAAHEPVPYGWEGGACAQDCTFINNTVIDNFGGAIYADSSLLSIANSTFEMNRCASVGGVGGALASEFPWCSCGFETLTFNITWCA
jgi:predicted outer membrane repeat protein